MEYLKVEQYYDVADELLHCNIKSYLLKLQVEVVRFKAEMYINEQKIQQNCDEIHKIGEDKNNYINN